MVGRLRWTAVLALSCGTLLGCAAASSGTSPAPSVGNGAVVGTASTSLGTVLVDSSGRTLYSFANDSAGQSTCTGACATYWPPDVVTSATPAPVSGVSATLGTIHRSDGSLQLTVNGLPVYTYAADSGPGGTAGQGVNSQGGLWWVVGPDGKAITTAPTASSTKDYGGGGWG